MQVIKSPRTSLAECRRNILDGILPREFVTSQCSWLQNLGNQSARRDQKSSRTIRPSRAVFNKVACTVYAPLSGNVYACLVRPGQWSNSCHPLTCCPSATRSCASSTAPPLPPQARSPYASSATYTSPSSPPSSTTPSHTAPLDPPPLPVSGRPRGASQCPEGPASREGLRRHHHPRGCPRLDALR
jgi:hypothetical protein